MRPQNLPTGVFDALRDSVRPGSSLCIAASGGGDSTALLRLAALVRAEAGISRLAALHVNHGLRGDESDGDERFVRDLAGELGIPFFVKRLSGKTLASSGMEAWAREARYAFFFDIMRVEGYDAVATGHTADDQAETVLQRLARGCGLRGLRGILRVRGDGVIRPLIGCTRAELAAWLDANGFPYRSDSSNASLAYERNWIRHRLLPDWAASEPHARDTLVAIAAKADQVWTTMAPAVEQWIAAFTMLSADRFTIAKGGLEDLLHAPEAIRTLFDRYGIEASAEHIDAIVARRRGRGATFLLPGGAWRYHPTRCAMEFFAQPAAPAPRFRITLAVPGHTATEKARACFEVLEIAPPFGTTPRDNRTVFLDRKACGNRLVFRSLRPKDRFVPFGRTTPVAVADFLAKQGLCALERKRCGVVTGAGGQIVWIPGIRIAEHARIGPDTRFALKISYQDYP